MYKGTLVQQGIANETDWFKVQYEDGDTEWLCLSTLETDGTLGLQGPAERRVKWCLCEHTKVKNQRYGMRTLLGTTHPTLMNFEKKSTFWSETGFGPLLGTSRRLASSECNFEHFLVYQIFTYLGKFDRWPTLDHALIWDSLGQFSFFLHQKIRLDE